MKYYLGLIKYRPNTKWFEVYKLIQAEGIILAEKKLRKWGENNISDKDIFVTVTETL
jgi:hypothetical protein